MSSSPQKGVPDVLPKVTPSPTGGPPVSANLQPSQPYWNGSQFVVPGYAPYNPTQLPPDLMGLLSQGMQQRLGSASGAQQLFNSPGPPVGAQGAPSGGQFSPMAPMSMPPMPGAGGGSGGPQQSLWGAFGGGQQPPQAQGQPQGLLSRIMGKGDTGTGTPGQGVQGVSPITGGASPMSGLFESNLGKMGILSLLGL